MSKKYIIAISVLVTIVILGGAYYLAKKHLESLSSAALGKNKYSIIKGSVNIDAVIEAVDDEDPSLPRLYDITLSISKGPNSFEYESFYVDRDSVDGVMAKLRGIIAWEGKYLLVPISCGGGNAWRCDIVQVFMVLNDRLVKVGEAGSDRYKEYRTGRFHDIYDKLEINDLTSHADAPGFIIRMDEIDGTMVANLIDTWKENQGRYSDNQVLLDRITKNRNRKSIGDLKTLPLLLFNSVLSKYCQKEDELNHWNFVANLLLDQASKAQLDSMITLATPGELPSSDQYE